VTPQISPPAGVSVATKGDRLRWRHSISGRWDLSFELLSKDYAIIQVLVTLQDWFGIKPMGKKNSKKTGKLLNSVPHGSLDSGPWGSDCARQAEGGLKSLVVQRAQVAMLR
jgi:hypothetical protein